MFINFECKKCKVEFNCDVGKIEIDEEKLRPIFENDIICPVCGKRSIDGVFLTELGQTQMTEATWDM